MPGTNKCGFTVTGALGPAVGWEWRPAHLGSEWEKLQVGNPAGVFIADFLSEGGIVSAYNDWGRVYVGWVDSSFKAPAGCRSAWLLSRSELFISKIVRVPKFPFPRKGF